MVKGKCAICGWNIGRLHKHHIIPLHNNGKDTDKNKIILCPNHHTEAHIISIGEFNIRNNLIGEKFTDEELKTINELSLEYYYFINHQLMDKNNPNHILFIKKNKKYVLEFNNKLKNLGIDEFYLMSRLMGITRREFIKNY